VALKFLLPDSISQPDVVTRFLREARAAVKIKSEHVARVTDVGTLDTGAPYMVMEYLQGNDLSAVVREQGRLPIDVAVEYVLQVSEAIAEAHALGIIHRDLKPANLFLTYRADGSPCVKVLDFGISKVTKPGAEAESGMTKTSTVIGSPLYMSPEQLQSSRSVDPRTDLWALGVILYELLAARPPFQAETYPQLVAAIMTMPPKPIERQRGDLPAELVAVIARCLEKDPAKRFRDVGELARALLPFGTTRGKASVERISKIVEGVRMPSNPVASAPSDATADADTVVASHSLPGVKTSASWGRTHPTERKRALRRALIWGAASLLLVGAIVALLMRERAGGGVSAIEATASAPPLSGTALPAAASLPVSAALRASSPDASGAEPIIAPASPPKLALPPSGSSALPGHRVDQKRAPPAASKQQRAGDGLFLERQ